jgi:acetate kinase
VIKALIAVNAGSSTLKFRAYAMEGGALLMRGLIDHFGQPHTSLSLHDTLHQQLEERELGDDSREAAVAAMLNTLADHGIAVAAVVHRVVHGGSHFHTVTRLDDSICQALEDYIPLAPLHQPVSLQVIQAFQTVDATLPQLACFDTAFHASQPEVATRFGIARHWHEEGVRRYGFHGLSYASISRRLAGLGLAGSKVVVCHLGSGSSACASSRGKAWPPAWDFLPWTG